MGEIDSRLEPEDVRRLADAAPLGRSKSNMSSTELTEYAGAAWVAFNLLESRIDALDTLGTGFIASRIDADLVVRLGAAAPPGRSLRHIPKVDITEFAGALYAGYESLAVRVGTLEGGPAGTELEGRLEGVDKGQLLEASALGRSKSKMNSKELTEWAGATDAAYTALEARVTAVESAT